MQSRRILIVEDEALSAKYFADIAEIMGMTVCGIAASAEDAIDMALTHHPDIALMDIRLRGRRDGIYVTRVIHRLLPTRIICVTASTDRRTMQRIQGACPFGILTKPVLSSDLERSITSALN